MGDKRTYAELATPAGLHSIARYAEGVGPSKDYIVPARRRRPLAGADDVRARRRTRRGAEGPPADLAGIGDLKTELRQFFALGVDGVFTDNPDIGVAARR